MSAARFAAQLLGRACFKEEVHCTVEIWFLANAPNNIAKAFVAGAMGVLRGRASVRVNGFGDVSLAAITNAAALGTVSFFLELVELDRELKRLLDRAGGANPLKQFISRAGEVKEVCVVLWQLCRCIVIDVRWLIGSLLLLGSTSAAKVPR